MNEKVNLNECHDSLFRNDNVSMVLAINQLKNREQSLLCQLNNLKKKLLLEVDKINEINEIRQTGWYVLLNRKDEGWVCSAVVNPEKNTEKEIPEDWDLCLPIPDPNTVPEFQGF